MVPTRLNFTSAQCLRLTPWVHTRRWVRPAELLAQLEGQPDALRAETVDVPDRQQTLRSTVEWSVERLGAEPRLVLNVLSAFAGGATPAMVRDVLERAGVPVVTLDAALVLADGPVLELSRLGAVRTQLLAELADARTRSPAPGVVGRPEEFPGWAGAAEVRLLLYDDALVIVPVGGEPEKLPYPFIRGVSTDGSGYRVTVEVTGREPLLLHRLASRTTEFVDLLRQRHSAAAGRTTAFLGALLPGLGAVALRTTAGLLRDGLAASRTDLDRVGPGVWPALAAAVTTPERAECLRTLEGLGETWIGFKQTISVERPAEGTQPWRDHAVIPDLGDHGARGSGFFGPFDVYGPALAYGMLGLGFGGSGFGSQHRMLPRADVSRSPLTPARTDLDALSAQGETPTVRAFALCLSPNGRLVYEVLNESAPATYVYRAADPDAVAALNVALDRVGFDVDDVHRGALLRAAFLGRIDHGERWAVGLRELLG